MSWSRGGDPGDEGVSQAGENRLLEREGPEGGIDRAERVADAILKGLERGGKREVFVPGYLKLVKYLPNWPVFTYRFRY